MPSPPRPPVIIMIAAGEAPGPALARSYAARGARVIAIDGDTSRLARLTGIDPERIEPLAVSGYNAQTLGLLNDAWGHEPIDMVVNLMPMSPGTDISAQMQVMSTALRATVRGLVAGRGAMVNVIPRPADRLALASQGLYGAITTAATGLAAELAPKMVRVHSVSVPRHMADLAVETLLWLGSDGARHLQGGTFDLD